MMRERFFIGLIGVMMLTGMFAFLAQFGQAMMPVASKSAPSRSTAPEGR